MDKDYEKILFTKKLKLNYNVETLGALKKILFSNNYNNQDVIIYGSSIYKGTARYASDTDAMEKVYEKDKNIIVKRFQEIIKNVLNGNKKEDYENQFSFGDIKIGIDDRINIDIGKIKDMKIIGFNQKKIILDLDKLKNKNIINDSKYNSIRSLIENINQPLLLDEKDLYLLKQSNIKKYKDSLTNWLKIKNEIRDLQILRWKPSDIINGYLIHNNKKFLLKDCFNNGMVKIDLIYYSSGSYMDVSNTMFFNIDNKPNMSSDIKDFQDGIKDAIFDKFYFLYYDFFKGFKLIYSLSRTKRDIKSLKKINDMLLSNLGIVSKLKSQINTCIDILKFYKLSNAKYEISVIRSVVDNIPQVLDMIYEFKILDFDLFNDFTRLFYDFDNKTDPEIVIDTLKLIKGQLLSILNIETTKYSIKHKFYPLDKKYLP